MHIATLVLSCCYSWCVSTVIVMVTFFAYFRSTNFWVNHEKALLPVTKIFDTSINFCLFAICCWAGHLKINFLGVHRGKSAQSPVIHENCSTEHEAKKVWLPGKVLLGQGASGDGVITRSDLCVELASKSGTVPGGLVGSAGQPVRQFGPNWNISTTMEWISMTCGTDIRYPFGWRKTFKNIDDPFTFPVALNSPVLLLMTIHTN